MQPNRSAGAYGKKMYIFYQSEITINLFIDNDYHKVGQKLVFYAETIDAVAYSYLAYPIGAQHILLVPIDTVSLSNNMGYGYHR